MSPLPGADVYNFSWKLVTAAHHRSQQVTETKGLFQIQVANTLLILFSRKLVRSLCYKTASGKINFIFELSKEKELDYSVLNE